jgi:hypothetical protein
MRMKREICTMSCALNDTTTSPRGWRGRSHSGRRRRAAQKEEG